MSHSSTVQRRSNIRSSSPSPSDCRGGRITDGESILPLTNRHNSVNGWNKIETRRRKKKSPLANNGSMGVAAVGTGSLVFFVLLMVLVIRETQQYHSRNTKHGHASLFTGTLLWSFFPFSSNQGTSITISSPPAVRVLQQKEESLTIFDVAIAGAGVAGLSAALFAARAGLNTGKLSGIVVPNKTA
jgi:hypothetical protein